MVPQKSKRKQEKGLAPEITPPSPDRKTLGKEGSNKSSTEMFEQNNKNNKKKKNQKILSNKQSKMNGGEEKNYGKGASLTEKKTARGQEKMPTGGG